MAMHQIASTGQTVEVDPAKGKAGEEADKTQDGKPIIVVKVYAPFKVYYEGKAFSLTATNKTGPFDILPEHHNFLCMLLPGNILINTALGETKTIHIGRALMHVREGKVTVFVDV